MTSTQKSIPCALIRGGTSRGAYFLASDLPTVIADRDAILRSCMGGPDALQIDGIGGGHPLSSKVAIVSASSREDADVNYLFLQVTPSTGEVSDGQNCGNILAGVGPFAIEQGLVAAKGPATTVKVHMINSGNLCELTVLTPAGTVQYDGDTVIDGVPGTAAPIICDFLDVAGSVTGAMLPTGNIVDKLAGIDVTCIDNGMPVVLLNASDLGCAGNETPSELDANTQLKEKIEEIRLLLGPKLNLGDVSKKTVPKMCLISPPLAGGVVSTRTFIPHYCHEAIGVLGAVSVATACLISGSVTEGIAKVPDGAQKIMDIEHPSGSFRIRLLVDPSAPLENRFPRAGVIRTARLLMQGEILVPSVV